MICMKFIRYMHFTDLSSRHDQNIKQYIYSLFSYSGVEFSDIFVVGNNRILE
jgi:hypothetical protein